MQTNKFLEIPCLEGLTMPSCYSACLHASYLSPFFVILFIIIICLCCVVFGGIMVCVFWSWNLLKCCLKLSWTFFAFSLLVKPENSRVETNSFLLTHFSNNKKSTSMHYICCALLNKKKNEHFHYISFVASLGSVTEIHDVFTFWEMNMRWINSEAHIKIQNVPSKR